LSVNKSKSIIDYFIYFCLFLIIFLCIILLILYYKDESKVYEINTSKYNDQEEEQEEVINKYQTSIVYDNFYTDINITSNNSAYKLIEEDSITQKDNCPKEILEIENRIIQNYNVKAVNLCEIDYDLAVQIEDIFKVIYDQYPAARGYMTNLTIGNLTMDQSNIVAFFKPSHLFSTTTNNSDIFKMIMVLNSRYFLNRQMLKLSSKNASDTGWWPKNATETSVVVHELGHYLSFLSSLNKNKYKLNVYVTNNNLKDYYTIINNFGSGNDSYDLLQEAYKNYLSDQNTPISFDEFRKDISNYAMSKDDDGNYLYDETIAEAFHDVYLNNENASISSIYIVNVLKSYLGG